MSDLATRFAGILTEVTGKLTNDTQLEAERKFQETGRIVKSVVKNIKNNVTRVYNPKKQII